MDPGRPVPLDGWALTLPVGNGRGGAARVDPAALTPPYLTAGAGGLLFWAPVAGATTPGSTHARTELTRRDGFAAGSGTHRLAASLTVRQVPAGRPGVIVGQIHGTGGLRAVPFVMLSWDGGAVRAVVKRARSGPAAEKRVLLTGVGVGERFDYALADGGDGTLTVSATGADGEPASWTIPLPAAFAGAPVRFQAGAYQRAESTPGAAADDGARVDFAALTAS